VSPTNNATSLAFSDYSDQVAYLTSGNNGVQLWIGNLDLTEVGLVWTDDQNWLHYDPNQDEINLRWEARDTFLTLVNRSDLVLYNVETSSAMKLSGPCETLAKSPRTNYYAALCPLASATASYVVLENDGTS
jgi:hypothetical protein